MEYIGSFTKTLVCVIIISFVLRSLIPHSKLEKNINFVIGLIVSITLVGAFLNVGTIDFGEIVIAEGEVVLEQEAKEIYQRKIVQNFEENIKKKVRDTVRDVSGCESECDVMLKINLEGNVERIEGVYVKVYGIYDSTLLQTELKEHLGLDGQIIHIGAAEYE